MALTQFEKDTLKKIHTDLQQPGKRLVDQDRADLEAIVSGEEDERKAVISRWIANVFIDRCTKQIAEIDAVKAQIQQELTDFQNY